MAPGASGRLALISRGRRWGRPQAPTERELRGQGDDRGAEARCPDQSDELVLAR